MIFLFCLKGVFERIENAVLLLDTNSMAPWYCLITFGDNFGSVLGFNTLQITALVYMASLEVNSTRDTFRKENLCNLFE